MFAVLRILFVAGTTGWFTNQVIKSSSNNNNNKILLKDVLKMNPDLKISPNNKVTEIFLNDNMNQNYDLLNFINNQIDSVTKLLAFNLDISVFLAKILLYFLLSLWFLLYLYFAFRIIKNMINNNTYTSNLKDLNLKLTKLEVQYDFLKDLIVCSNVTYRINYLNRIKKLKEIRKIIFIY